MARVESIEAIAMCLYGRDLKENVIQKMAAEFYKVRGLITKLVEKKRCLKVISFIEGCKKC